MTATLPGLDALPAQPRRLRFNRYDGKRLPAGAKLVTRGTRWGNPHPVAERTPAGHAAAVDLYRQHLRERPELVALVRRNLAGHSLACACPLDWPCHADVLLAVARGEQP